MRVVRLRLREKIPLLLLAVASIAGALSWFLNLHYSLSHVRASAVAEAREAALHLREGLRHELQEVDADGLQRALTGLGLNHHIYSAAIVDAAGRVMASNRSIPGEPATLPPWPGGMRPRRETPGGAPDFTSIEQVDGLIDLRLPLAPASAELVMRYDYTGQLDAARRHAQRLALLFGLLIAASAAILGLYLHHRVTGPAARIVSIVDRFGRGERDARCAMSGTDELQRVGQALDRMMTRVDESQTRLAEAEAGHRILIENLPGAVFVDYTDRPGWTKYVGPQLKTLFGHDPDQWIAGGYEYWRAHVHPEDRERATQLWLHSCATGTPYFCEYRLLSPNGRQHWVQDTAAGQSVRVQGERLSYGFMLDVSVRRQAEEALRESEALMKTAQSIAHIGSWSAQPSLDGVIHCSEECYRLFGVDPVVFDHRVRSWLAGVHPSDRALMRAAFTRLIDTGATADLRYRFRRPDGQLRWIHCHAERVHVARDNSVMLTGVVQDVTEQVEAERRIERLAYHDLLTGLPNRALFADRLKQALAHAQRGESHVAVLYLDLDHFKSVNDTLGHAIGDRLLQVIANRLTAALREGDTVARYGGDEFIVLLPHLATVAHAAEVAEHLCAALREPVLVDGQTLHVTATIGLSCASANDGLDSETLIRHADIALYAAKSAGRNTYRFFNGDMDRLVQERRQLEGDLRLALERGEFLLHYQPQRDLKTGLIVGVEALLRWQHPTRGLVSPAEFIPLAEESQLILPIGEWVLGTAAAQIAAWRAAGGPRLRMALNLSARQFQDQALPDKIRGALHAMSIEPSCIELEITESSMLRQADHALEMLHVLRDIGVQIAIDDFGTGYSNLGTLKQYPFARLKIDRLFIRDIPESAEASAIVRAILAMADALKLTVVAEGVETADQYDYLLAQGCHEVQGYYTGRPMSADALMRQLALDAHPVRASQAG